MLEKLALFKNCCMTVKYKTTHKKRNVSLSYFKICIPNTWLHLTVNILRLDIQSSHCVWVIYHTNGVVLFVCSSSNDAEHSSFRLSPRLTPVPVHEASSSVRIVEMKFLTDSGGTQFI